MKTRLSFAGLGLLAASAPLFAEIPLGENFFLSGYAVGAVTNTETDSGDEDTAFDSGVSNFDSVKLLAKGVVGPITGVVSGFYIPEFTGADDEAGVLDAYATFTSGAFSVTGGKFLSWLGYEAFDPINMTQLTYGASIFAIPAYHTGAKAEYSVDEFSLGVAAVDSVMPGSGFFQGDGDFDDDIGFEAYFTWKGTENLTVFTGVAFEDTEGMDDNLAIFDIWASYKVSDAITIAGEFDVYDNVGWGWLGFVQYTFNDMFSVIGRLSGADFDDGSDVLGATIAPTVTINEYVSFRAELSQLDLDGEDVTFYGAQAVLKF